MLLSKPAVLGTNALRLVQSLSSHSRRWPVLKSSAARRSRSGFWAGGSRGSRGNARAARPSACKADYPSRPLADPVALWIRASGASPTHPTCITSRTARKRSRIGLRCKGEARVVGLQHTLLAGVAEGRRALTSVARLVLHAGKTYLETRRQSPPCSR